MYDATTRATYAELYKAAAMKAPARMGGALVEVVKKHPLLAASLKQASESTGGTR